MKNLENFGVQEMNIEELIGVDGGGFFDSFDFEIAIMVGAIKIYKAAAEGFEAGANAVVEAHNNMYH